MRVRIPPSTAVYICLKIQTLFERFFCVTHSWIFPAELLLLCLVTLDSKCMRNRDFRFSFWGFEVALLRQGDKSASNHKFANSHHIFVFSFLCLHTVSSR